MKDVSRVQDSRIILVVDISSGVILVIPLNDVIGKYVVQIICLQKFICC